jgi:hypothetical protein
VNGGITRDHANLLAAVLALRIEKILEREAVGNDVVKTPVQEIQVGLFLGRIKPDCGILVVLLEEVGMNRRALRADGLALERGR